MFEVITFTDLGFEDFEVMILESQRLESFIIQAN